MKSSNSERAYLSINLVSLWKIYNLFSMPLFKPILKLLSELGHILLIFTMVANLPFVDLLQFWKQSKKSFGFPGGPVPKTPCSQRRGPGFNP